MRDGLGHTTDCRTPSHRGRVEFGMWLRGHSTSFQCILTAPRFVLLAADELLGSRAMCALGVVDFLEAVVRAPDLPNSLRFPSRQQLRHTVR